VFGVLAVVTETLPSQLDLQLVSAVANLTALAMWRDGAGVHSTEPRAALAGRTTENDRLRRIVASSPTALFTVTLERGEFRGIGWMSDNVEQLLGYPARETLGADWWLNNIHPDDRDRVVVEYLSEIFVRGESTSEYRFRHRDGSYRRILGKTRLVRDAASNPAEAVGSISDVSERRSLEGHSLHAQRMEALGLLVGEVAHDFNNFLTIFAGITDALLAQT